MKDKKQEVEDIKEIAVTLEPLRYFAEQIAGNRYTFFSVVPVGQSPETYDPTPREMIRVGKGIAYLHIGQLGFEQMLVKSIQENNSGTFAFDLSEGMDFHEGVTEASHDSHKECAEEGHHHNHSHSHFHGHDPHIWTSFKGARIMSGNILKALSFLDEENKDYYQSNYQRLISRLNLLEDSLHAQLKDLSCRSFIIYHPALTYFADEFGLQQYSIENDGKEPSPALLKKLIEETNAEKVGVVFVQMEFDRKHAEQIAREIGANTVVINPLDYQWEKQMGVIVKSLVENGETD